MMTDRNSLAAVTPIQKVMVVNGNSETLERLETLLDAGRYDMVFVESVGHAYSQVRKVMPDLIILCTQIQELAAFQLLTMLKLDRDTREIPVLTFATEQECGDFEDSISQLTDADDIQPLLPCRPAPRMN